VFCELYVKLAKKPLSLTVTSLNHVTGLTPSHLKEFLGKLHDNENFTIMAKERGYNLIPDKFLAKLSGQNVESNQGPVEPRLFPIPVDEVISIFKQRIPGLRVSAVERGMLTNLATEYSFETIKKIVNFAFDNHFWSDKLKCVSDLFKKSEKNGKARIANIKFAMDKEEENAAYKRTAMM
jgi:hypothetical protein